MRRDRNLYSYSSAATDRLQLMTLLVLLILDASTCNSCTHFQKTPFFLFTIARCCKLHPFCATDCVVHEREGVKEAYSIKPHLWLRPVLGTLRMYLKEVNILCGKEYHVTL